MSDYCFLPFIYVELVVALKEDNYEATKSALNCSPFLFRALFRVFRVIRGLPYESRTTNHTKHTKEPDTANIQIHEKHETERIKDCGYSNSVRQTLSSPMPPDNRDL